MVLRGLRRLAEAGGRFVRDRGGSITVDFVVSIPILIGVLVLTSEYGKLLQTRTILDNAVADATRYLARMPLDESTNFFYPNSITQAEALIRDRLDVEQVTVAQPALLQNGDVRWVSITADAMVDVPALSLLNLATTEEIKLADGTSLRERRLFPISSQEAFRHFGR